MLTLIAKKARKRLLEGAPSHKRSRAAPPATGAVLFLCTGNYFRSRYAEIFFNHLNRDRICPWHACSRGLALERLHPAAGAISPYTLQRLEQRGIRCPAIARLPLPVGPEDLQNAGLIIALKAAEHRPLIRERHPEWLEKVDYWSVDDIDCIPADAALDQIEEHVQQLWQRLLEVNSRTPPDAAPSQQS